MSVATNGEVSGANSVDLSQLESKIAELQKQFEAKGSDRQKASNEKEILKLEKEKKSAERNLSVTFSLVSDAEKDNAKIPEEGRKIHAKLEATRDTIVAKKNDMTNKIESAQSVHDQTKKDLAASSAELAATKTSEQAVFEKQLDEFKQVSSASKESLWAKIQSLQEEKAVLSATLAQKMTECKSLEDSLQQAESDLVKKEAEISKKESELAKKLKDAHKEERFANEELSRVNEESKRKQQQLDNLNLQDRLEELRIEEIENEKKKKLLKIETDNAERALKAQQEIFAKTEQDHKTVSSDYGTKKESIMAEIHSCSVKAEALEKTNLMFRLQISELEENSWKMNSKYSDTINRALEKSKSGRTVEETKKLKSITAEVKKEEEIGKNLQAKVDALEKDLKAEKKRMDKVKKASTTKEKKAVSKDQAQLDYFSNDTAVQSRSRKSMWKDHSTLIICTITLLVIILSAVFPTKGW